MLGSCWDVGMEGGGGLTESYRSCRVFCASCLRLIGLLGLKTEWNCAFRAFALSVSAVQVLALAFSTAIPLGSCFECLRREYSFFGFDLGWGLKVMFLIV